MLALKAKIIQNKNIKGKYFHCVLEALDIAKLALPGQFIEVKVSEGFEPLLRRPFSIHRVDNGKLELLYEVVGVGSAKLSERKSGEELDIIGPLGNGFSLGLDILVAGGMGAAPLLFLAEKVFSCKPKVVSRKLMVLIGAKTKEHILCESKFKKIGCEVKISTDDGSDGFHGRVTDLLVDILRAQRCKRELVIGACGPRPMLKRVSEISEEFDCLSQISLEEYMACGIGACLGCVVQTTNGFKRVCKEGPVFDAREIIWEA
ncbi:MAG: dihydroorotate dehydrogenase electron transfer subunit [Candidatus Omnitrophota bacterium]